MNRRALGVVLLVLGVLVLLMALGADLLGLGTGPSFGPRQVAGAVVGAVVAVCGLLLRA